MSFLTNSEIENLKEYLIGYVSLPFGRDIPGEIVEELVARARGAVYEGKRANRPEPDMVLTVDGKKINYQIKTEKNSDNRVSAKDKIGKTEDIITARIDVQADFKLKDLPNDPNEVGKLVLQSFVKNVIQKYKWQKLAILLRFKQNSEFLYFEEDVVNYNPDDYEWEPTTAGKRENKLNIIGYKKDKEGKLDKTRKKFKWNVGTTLLYVFHDIPENADYFEIRKKFIDPKMFRDFMEKQSYPTDEQIKAWVRDAIELNENIPAEYKPKEEDTLVNKACVTVSGKIPPKADRKALREELIKTLWSTPCIRDVQCDYLYSKGAKKLGIEVTTSKEKL